jgi:hypothetical protein
VPNRHESASHQESLGVSVSDIREALQSLAQQLAAQQLGPSPRFDMVSSSRLPLSLFGSDPTTTGCGLVSLNAQNVAPSAVEQLQALSSNPHVLYVNTCTRAQQSALAQHLQQRGFQVNLHGNVL